MLNDPGTMRCAAALAIVLTIAWQGGTSRYVYDDNGRLRAVVSPAGQIAVYEYDPAGNFTSIRRLGPEAVELLTFFPREGAAGDLVTLVGAGIGPGTGEVFFNGVGARIVEASPATVIAEVPEGASTGTVSINTPRGVLNTPTPFTVLPRVRVIPPTVTLLMSEATQFQAVVSSLSGDRSVSWSVNGVEGGSNDFGTVSAAGLYTAPGVRLASVIVRATSRLDPSLFGEARVSVASPDNVQALNAPSVTVQRGPFFAASLKAPSVISVRYGSAPGFGVARASSVSVTTGPAILQVQPTTLARGATSSITINGENLSGATSVRFLSGSGGLDPLIVASDLSASADGRRLTAAVFVGADAQPGRRVFFVTAVAGRSPVTDTGFNAITISQ